MSQSSEDGPYSCYSTINFKDIVSEFCNTIPQYDENINNSEPGDEGKKQNEKSSAHPLVTKEKSALHLTKKRFSWNEEMITTLVNIICDNEDFRKKLIFENTKNSANTKIYEHGSEFSRKRIRSL